MIRYLRHAAIALALVIPTFVTSEETLTGRATVTDGDTIAITGATIRLHGIDAPEASQRCMNETSTEYRCGRDAAFYLADMLERRTVSCEARDRDRYGRIVASCFFDDAALGRIDVNATMVNAGHALAYRRYSRDYIPEEAAARAAGRGMWRGTFTPPWDWRRQ